MEARSEVRLETIIEKRLKAEGVEYASTLAALIAVDVEQAFSVVPKKKKPVSVRERLASMINAGLEEALDFDEDILKQGLVGEYADFVLDESPGRKRLLPP